MEFDLKLARRLVSESRVFAVGIVVTFDVFEDFCPCVPGRLEASVLEHFEFERSNEGLCPSVVVGVGPGKHALTQAGVFQKVAEGRAAILASTVAVEDGAFWEAALERLAKGVDDQIRAHVVGEAPAHNPTRAEVDDDG